MMPVFIILFSYMHVFKKIHRGSSSGNLSHSSSSGSRGSRYRSGSNSGTSNSSNKISCSSGHELYK